MGWFSSLFRAIITIICVVVVVVCVVLSACATFGVSLASLATIPWVGSTLSTFGAVMGYATIGEGLLAFVGFSLLCSFVMTAALRLAMAWSGLMANGGLMTTITGTAETADAEAAATTGPSYSVTAAGELVRSASVIDETVTEIEFVIGDGDDMVAPPEDDLLSELVTASQIAALASLDALVASGELKKAEAALAQVQAELETALADVTLADEQRAALQLQLADVKAQKEELSAANAALQLAKAGADKQVATLQEQLEKADVTLTSLAETISTLVSDKDSLNAALTDATTALSKANADVAKLKAQTVEDQKELAALQLSYEELLASSTATATSLGATIAALESELEKSATLSEETIAALQVKLQQAKDAKAAVDDVLSTLKHGVATAVDSADAIQGLISTLSASLDPTDSDEAAVLVQLTEVKATYEAALAKVKKLDATEAQLQSAREQLDAAIATIAKLSATVGVSGESVSLLQQQVKMYESALANLESQVTAAAGDQSAALDLISQLKSDNKKLRDAAREASKSNTDSRSTSTVLVAGGALALAAAVMEN